MVRCLRFLVLHPRSLAGVALAGLGLAGLAGPVSAATAVEAFDPGKAGFSLRLHGEVSSYRVLGVSVMPGERLVIEVVEAPTGTTFELVEVGARPFDGLARRWTWTAPAAPGLVPLEVRRVDTGEEVRLNVFVLVPASKVRDGWLNGYRIGDYPTKPLRGLSIYRPPRGFVEVTEANRDTPVAPHFTLGQFLCKQEGSWPRYLVLRERLLLKLEYLLERVNEKGLRADTFFVMSGFRTPHYNAAIRNVKYSRHQWGGAADIFIDENPRDGLMDDLDGDGRSDRRDAELLYEMIEGLGHLETYAPYVGGLGLYGTTAAHGPFIHVDARGFRARWGR